MSIFLILALVPDVGMRGHGYCRNANVHGRRRDPHEADRAHGDRHATGATRKSAGSEAHRGESTS